MIQLQKTIGDYVADNIKTAHVFKKYGIDFCCGGGITLEHACEKHGLDINIVREELSNVELNRDRSFKFNNWQPGFLIDYIVNEHHSYVRESLPIISEYASKVARVHGQNYPEVVQVNEIITEVVKELSAHLQKEEQILFPYIKELESADNDKRMPHQAPFGHVNNPITMMEKEHESAGDAFKAIAELTNNYTPPMGACFTFRALYSKLQEFEEDLHQHIHLENNILHKKALQLQ